MSPKIGRLRRAWRACNGAELSARLAALQLLPENTPFSARLLAASNVVATLGARRGAHAPGLDWLNGDVFGRDGLGVLDDPYEEWFTESVPFFGGPYTILPGREGGRGALLRLLLRAIYFDETFDAGVVPDGTTAMVLAALRLSHSAFSQGRAQLPPT